MKLYSIHDLRKFFFLFIQDSSIASDIRNCSAHPIESLRNVLFFFSFSSYLSYFRIVPLSLLKIFLFLQLLLRFMHEGTSLIYILFMSILL
jgi:hypothetical protein